MINSTPVRFLSKESNPSFKIHRPQHFLNFTSFEDGGDGPAGAEQDASRYGALRELFFGDVGLAGAVALVALRLDSIHPYGSVG